MCKKTPKSLVSGMNCTILNEGIKNISAGTVDYTEGADIRPWQSPKQSAMKSEAHESLVRG